MKSFIQVLTTPTADTPGTTLLLHFDNKRYLIGSMAEGTQRAMVQMGTRITKVSECFITGRTEWKNTGGLIGMILTLADQMESKREAQIDHATVTAMRRGEDHGIRRDREKMDALVEEFKAKIPKNEMRIFAPPNLNHTIATARRFVFRKGMPLDINEVDGERSVKEEEGEKWAPYWTDENIKVWPISILPAPAAETAMTNVSRPITPRKRTIDEVYDRQNTANGTKSRDLTEAEHNQLTAKAVVAEMFDSPWRLDALYETSLSRVKLPATLFIRNAETNKIERYTGPLPGGKVPVPDPDLTVLVRKPWPGALISTLPETHPRKEAISYIVRLHPARGKFLPDVAKRLKVKPGPEFTKLANGESVQNADGETVTPDMVLAPTKPGGGFAVIDLPDPSYIDNLVARPEWSEEKIMQGVEGMVWICGDGVALDSRVHEFMRRFGKLQHTVSSPEHCVNRISLDSVAASTARLAQVDPKRYGIPDHDNEPSQLAKAPLPVGNMHIAQRGAIIQIEPTFQAQNHLVVPPLDIAAVEKDMLPEVLHEAAKARQAVLDHAEQTESWSKSLPIEDAEIITLGTGSAAPSKYRNVSATLVRVPGWGSLLLDCGESTLGQLKRVFAPQEFKAVLRDLRLITISHMHADHHLGTTGVVKAWYSEVHNCQPIPLPDIQKLDLESLLSTSERRLAIIAEPAMLEWLAEYAAVEDYGYSRLAPLNISPAQPFPPSIKPSVLNWFIPASALTNPTGTPDPDPTTLREARNSLINKATLPTSLLHLADVQAVNVNHCHNARAISITWPSGFKVSYSGDCRPSRTFSEIGKGSTVCIHEATFDDDLAGDAQAKKHSTTSEALGVAMGMGAKACVLTHFSQRYQKIPVLERERGGGEEDGDAKVVDDVEEEQGGNNDGEDAEMSTVDDIVAPTLPAQDTLGPAVKDSTHNYTPMPAIDSSESAPTHAKKERFAEMASRPAAVTVKVKGDMKVCVAFDYMRVKVGEIGELEKFTPALLRLFAEEHKKGDGDVVGGEADGAVQGKGGKKKEGKKQKGGKRNN